MKKTKIVKEKLGNFSEECASPNSFLNSATRWKTKDKENINTNKTPLLTKPDSNYAVSTHKNKSMT